MKLKVKPETLLFLTKISINLNACWPSTSDLSSTKLIILDVLCFLCLLSTLLLLFPLWYSVYLDWNDPLVLSKSLLTSSGTALAAAKIIVFRVNRRRLQVLLDEMTDFMRKSNEEEKNVMQHYVDKHAILHIGLSICCYMATILVVIGPFILPTPFPTDAKYPFSLNSSMTRFIIFAHQGIVGIQVASGMCSDCLAASLLWFTIMRFRLLSKNFQNIQSILNFQQCIHQHQHLLRYGHEVSSAIRFMVFTTMTATTISSVFSGIHIFSNEPLVDKLQYFVCLISGGALLFLTTWPAELLIDACYEVGNSLFKSSWNNLPQQVRKQWIFVIQASHQVPVVITIPGMLPILSLKCYTEFWSKVFSFFATVRILVE